MFTTSCNSAASQGEHWTWSPKTRVLKAALSPTDGEIINMSSLPQFLFHESTELLINNKDKILVTKKMYDVTSYMRNASLTN